LVLIHERIKNTGDLCGLLKKIPGPTEASWKKILNPSDGAPENKNLK
jgi:hypothetical protein